MSSRLIISIAILASAFLFGFFLTWPKYQDFQGVRSELGQKEEELSSKTAYYSKINGVWEKLKSHEDSLAKISAFVPQGYSIPVLFNYFQRTAGETGLIIEGLTFGGAVGDKVKEVNINFKASGDYPSLKNFLSAIENSERLFKIKNISLSSSDNEKKFSFSMEISTYSY